MVSVPLINVLWILWWLQRVSLDTGNVFFRTTGPIQSLQSILTWTILKREIAASCKQI